MRSLDDYNFRLASVLHTLTCPPIRIGFCSRCPIFPQRIQHGSNVFFVAIDNIVGVIIISAAATSGAEGDPGRRRPTGLYIRRRPWIQQWVVQPSTIVTAIPHLSTDPPRTMPTAFRMRWWNVVVVVIGRTRSFHGSWWRRWQLPLQENPSKQLNDRCYCQGNRHRGLDGDQFGTPQTQSIAPWQPRGMTKPCNHRNSPVHDSQPQRKMYSQSRYGSYTTIRPIIIHKGASTTADRR